MRRLARRALGRTWNEVVGAVRLDTAAVPGERIDCLRVVYPGDDVVAYVNDCDAKNLAAQRLGGEQSQCLAETGNDGKAMSFAALQDANLAALHDSE